MTLPILADLAALVTAAFAWRVSKPIGAAIALAMLASLVHAETGIEALRWSSALVGLVGVVELGRRARQRRLLTVALHNDMFRRAVAANPWRPGEAFEIRAPRPGRPDALGVLCLASMGGDGAALAFHRAGLPWVFDMAQIIVSGLVIAVCVWPRRRAP